MNLALLERYGEARDRLTDGTRTFPDHQGFTRALARLLAAAPDDRVRDPRRALALAEELLDRPQQSAQDSLAVGETYAMALAGVGQYAAAAAVQRDVRAQAASFGDLADRLAENLRLYERGEPSRRPWTAGEIP